ncbi:MAG: hypothetical protein AAFP19_06355, partial [Bacteroidota bacterium]
DQVQLRIYNAAGVLLSQQEGNFDQGEQYFLINGQTLPEAGILYYQLDTKWGNRTKKMVLMR